MQTKLSYVRAAMQAGDWPAALKLAAKFPDLGAQRKPITLGYEAHAYPGFYRQLGHDPESLVEAGKQALILRYGE